MPEQQPLTEEQKKELQEKLKKMSPEQLRQFQKQQCIFCQIVAGKVPAKKVYEDEQSIAILDINPATPGHLLILPKEHYAIMPQVPAEELGSLFLISKKLSQALLRALKVAGTTLFIANGLAAGQKSQHFMVHLIPRKEADHVLDIEEKVLDTEARRKAMKGIENKLNELLGIKKEVVSLEDKKKAEKKEPTTTSEEQKRERTRKGSKTKTVPTPLPPEDKEVSLDDIANLFK